YRAVEGDVEAGRELQRAAAGAFAPLDHGEDHLGTGRAAEVYRIDHLLRGQVLREELAERHGGRLVDDEADMALLAERPGDQDGISVQAVPEVALGDQQDRVAEVGRPGERRAERQGDYGKDGQESHGAIS